MALKRILVPLMGRHPSASALEAGMSLARRFGATMAAFHPAIDPVRTVAMLTETVTPGVVEAVFDNSKKESEERVAAARGLFDQLAGKNTGIAAEFSTRPGLEGDLVAEEARLADLTVTQRPDDDGDADEIIVVEAAIMESGRPVLLVPPRGGGLMADLKTVLIAWNNSPEAARAVSAALPFLPHAEKVVVATIGDVGGLSGLTSHLKAHGITAQTHQIKEGFHLFDDRTGAVLLQEASAIGAGLLVMGAYSHNRLRQTILGGATRKVLADAKIPVLMAH